MSRPQADNYMQQLATQGMGPWQPVRPPNFAATALVDPESPVFGQPIPSSIHPDTRGGRNLVPIQDVFAVRQQMQYEAAHPDEMAQVERSRQMDPNLPLADRLRARAGLQARTLAELGEATSAVNERYKQWAGNKGADAGEVFAQFMAKNFQDDPSSTPGEIGVARSIGKNIAVLGVDPITYAMGPLGSTGKAGQIAISALFAADAAKGSYDAAGQLGSIWDRSDIPRQQKIEMGTDLVLSTAMAGMAGTHALRTPFLHESDPLLASIPQGDRALVADQVNIKLANAPTVVPHPNPLAEPFRDTPFVMPEDMEPVPVSEVRTPESHEDLSSRNVAPADNDGFLVENKTQFPASEVPASTSLVTLTDLNNRLDQLERDHTPNRILETHPQDVIHDGAVIAKKGEYKYNPILVHPKIKGAASISSSEFFNAHIPGEIHELSAKNLAAILGKPNLKSKSGELTPEQKALLKNAETDEEGRMYREQFVRQRVEELHNHFVSSAKKRLQVIKTVKDIRGIPATGLSPLEAKLAAIMEAEKKKRQPSHPAGLLEPPKRSSQPKNRPSTP